jgi:hypothetical protein
MVAKADDKAQIYLGPAIIIKVDLVNRKKLTG